MRATKSLALVETQLAAANKLATESAKRGEQELVQLTEMLEAQVQKEERDRKEERKEIVDMLLRQGGANKAKLEQLVCATGAWRDEASELEMVSRSAVEETKINTDSQIKVFFKERKRRSPTHFGFSQALETATAQFGERLVGELSGTRDQFHHYFDSLKEGSSLFSLLSSPRVCFLNSLSPLQRRADRRHAAEARAQLPGRAAARLVRRRDSRERCGPSFRGFLFFWF